MIIIFLILSLCFIAFLSGTYSARLIRFSSAWIQSLCIPFLVLVAICWIYRAPWYWIFIQLILQVVCIWIGIGFQKSQLTHAQVERLQKIGDLGLERWIPAGIKDEQIAVVLLDDGGPTSIDQVKLFMRRKFNDTHVFRFPFVHLIYAYFFVNDRLKEFKECYQSIGGGSPISAACLNQVTALNDEFQKRGRNFKVFLSFNYSDPLPTQTIARIKETGRKYVLPVSLHPQYSMSTTEAHISNLKEVADKNYPEARFLESYSYHLDDGYIQAIVDRIHESIQSNENLNDFYILFSAQGTPTYFLEEGDPYSYLISQSVAVVLKKINRNHNWSISYQGKLRSISWLEPSTENVLIALAQKAVKKIIVVPISFVTERIETTYEIDSDYRDLAQGEGVKDFRMTKAIDCHPGFIKALADCVEKSLSN